MSDTAPAEMHQAARDGAPGAQAALSAWYQQRYPEPADETGPAPAPARLGDLLGVVPTVDVADAERGVPPDSTHYFLSPSIERAPEVASEMRAWGAGMRMSVDELAQFGRELERLADHYGPHIPDEVLRGEGEEMLAQLKGTPEGQATLDRARAHWRRLESRHPELADILGSVGAPSDARFVELLGRTYRP